MKKLLITAIAASLSLGFTACDDFLDSENYTEATTENYPASASDLNTLVAALYGVMNQYSTDPLQTPWMIWNVMSDDSNGAGGTGDVEASAIAHIMTNKDGLYDDAWHNTYVGISRANSIISSVGYMIDDSNRSDYSQMLGEAYFLRGLYTMWGSQLWGDIPAYWEASAPDPCPQQDAETVIYPHILADFYTAYNLMSYGATTQGDGHATKAAAGGYLARAYMFYQGFYKKAGELATASLAAVTLPDQESCEGVSLTKDAVVTILEDVRDNSGNCLIEDFRLLWQYTNDLTAPDYNYVADLDTAGIYWAGNGNAEQLFQVQYSNIASWNGTIGMGFTNMTSLYVSLRCGGDNNGYAATLPYAQGWGQGVINRGLWDTWSDSDARKLATILDCEAECGVFDYVSDCSEETGLYNKKWIAVTCSESNFSDISSGPYTWWGVYRAASGYTQNNGNSMQGDHFCDIVLMRFADILLMHTELTGDASGMNTVRARAGLAEKSYSWQSIKDERRYEFAGEGIRFNDLRRWSGKNGGASCEAATALDAQAGTEINYCGKSAVLAHANGANGWANRYASTDGFLFIPPAQISLAADESVLKQNEGWGSSVSAANMTAKPSY